MVVNRVGTYFKKLTIFKNGNNILISISKNIKAKMPFIFKISKAIFTFQGTKSKCIPLIFFFEI